jgi:uncharacterized repeat protein (TIGR01451 family)
MDEVVSEFFAKGRHLIQRRRATFVLRGLILLTVLLLFRLAISLAAASPDVTLDAHAEMLVEVGELVDYTVTNSSHGQATNLMVTHKLPVGFTYQPGSTEVRQNGQLISSADPILNGRYLTWGAFTAPGAVGMFDNTYGIHTFVQDLCVESYVDFQLDKALELAGMGGHVTQLFHPVTASTTGPQPCWVYFVNGTYDRTLVPILRIQGEWGGDFWLKPEPDAPGDYTSIAQAYKRVVEGLPRRDGHTLYIQVWNEPDVTLEWSGEPSAWEYGNFFVDVAAAIHSIGDPRIKVLNGALTPGNTGFTRQLGSVPGFVQSFDLWASHCYPFNHPPSYNIHNRTARYRQYTIDCYLLELEELARAGRTGVKVILTETGYALYDSTFRFEGYPSINEGNRANYIKSAFRDYWLSWPEVVGVTPFELVDPYGTWPIWDWLHPTTDIPHEQFNAVKALPKPDPLDVMSAELTITLQAWAGDIPGTYHSDFSATADNTTISPLIAVAPVVVADSMYSRIFPLIVRDSGRAQAEPQPDFHAQDSDSTWEFPDQLDLSLPEPAPPTGPVVFLASPEHPGETPALLPHVNVGSNPQGVALDPLTQRAYVTLGDGNLVVIDTSENRILSTVPVGLEPQGVAVNPTTGLVYVANSGEGTVSVVDGATYRVVDAIRGFVRPCGLAVDEVTDRIYISDAGADCLAVVDGKTNEIVRRVPVGSYPDAVAVDSDADRLYVVNAGEGTLSVIEGTSLEAICVISITQGPLLGMAVDERTGQVYVVYLVSPLRRGIAVIDGRRGKVTALLIGNMDRPLNCTYAVAVDDQRGRLYIADGGELLVVNTQHQTLMTGVPVEAVTYNFGLAVDAARERVYLLDSSSGMLLVFGH